MSAGELQLHVAIGSRFENIDLVLIALEDSLRRRGLDEDSRHWIDLAVREAVANAIKHGNRGDPEKEVAVDVALEGGDLVITITDEGEGFDPSVLESPVEPENLLRPNGRGIFYMKNFMDDINYAFRPGGGTVVTLRKRIAPATGEPDGGEEEERQP